MHTAQIKPLLKLDKLRPKLSLASLFHRHRTPLKILRSAHSRRFMKEYSLPILVSLVLLLMFGMMYFLRASERASLADWFYGIAGGGDGYSTLLSQDKTDEFKKNDANGEPVQPPASPNQASSPASPGSFTVNPSGPVTTPGGTSPSPSPSPTPVPPVFSASISYFRQDSEALECPGLIITKNRCSKKYVFGAGIRTLNGPGSVSYSWQSNLPAANQSSSFSAGSGDTTMPLQKEIVLSCKDPGNYTLQIAVTSPTQTQSGVLPINHVCNI